MGLVTGCTSPEQKSEAAAESARSWEATLRLTREAVVAQEIPRVYARQVLEAAREHERAHRGRPEWESLPPRLKQQLAAAADRLASDLGQSSERHDR